MQVYIFFQTIEINKITVIACILTVCFIVNHVKRLGPEGKKSSIWQLPAIGACKFLMVVTDKDSEFFFKGGSGFKD